MKWMLALCLCGGLGCTGDLPSSSSNGPALTDPRPKREYKIVIVPMEHVGIVYDVNAAMGIYNTMGDEGWEFVQESGGARAAFRRRKQ